MAFLTKQQLDRLRRQKYFGYLGENVQISDKAVFYNPQNIHIHDHSRIDDFAILSTGGKIVICEYVHVGCMATLIGKGDITLCDYSGISSRVSIYSSSDKYTGHFMTNPCVPPHVKNTYHSDVVLGKHSVVGSGSVILPGIILHDGAAVGALSLVNQSVPRLHIVGGTPARYLAMRSDNIFNLEKEI